MVAPTGVGEGGEVKSLVARVPVAMVSVASIALTACGHAEAPRARVLGVEYTKPSTDAGGEGGESLAPGVYVEHDDSSGYFTVGDDDAEGAGHAAQLDRSTKRLTFVIWATPQPDGTAAVQVTLTNTSGRLIRLDGGAAVEVHMTHDGQAMDDYVLTDPTLTQIGPDETVEVRGAMPLQGGSYAYWAATTIHLV
jgi:hypothetical protein